MIINCEDACELKAADCMMCVADKGVNKNVIRTGGGPASQPQSNAINVCMYV